MQNSNISNKNGKLFGIINPVDLLFILLIIGLVFGGYYKFNSSKTNVKANEKKIQYTILVKGVRDFTLEYYAKDLEVFDKKTSELIGKIVDVRSEEYRERVYGSDGNVTYVVKPEAKNVYIDVETNANVTDTAFYANGTYEIKVGSEINFSTLYSEVIGTVYDIKSN